MFKVENCDFKGMVERNEFNEEDEESPRQLVQVGAFVIL